MLAFLSIVKLILILIWSLIAIGGATIAFIFTWNPRICIFLAKHLWSPTMLFLLGARVKVVGRENIQKGVHYLIVANHSSYADIPTLFRTLPLSIRFIGKTELKKVPFLGFYMKIAGMIFIDRSNPRKARTSIREAAETTKKGSNVVIFPEGTTTEGSEIGPFKRGVALMAKEAESPLLPVRIKGTHRVWPGNSNLKIRGGGITVVIGAPIPFENYRDTSATELLKELSDQLNAL